MLVYLAFLGAIFLVAWIWSKFLSRRDIETTLRDANTGLSRALESSEAILEELHQCGSGNVCAVLRLTSEEPLVLDYFEEALDILKDRHQLLKCAIIRDQITSQMYFRDVSFDCETILKRSERKAHQWQEAVEDNCDAVLDTVNGPLWRVTWLQESYDRNSGTYENTILFICHHAIVDGISIMNLPKQFTECINCISKGQLRSYTPHYPIVPGIHARTRHHIKWSLWQQMLLIPQIIGIIMKTLLPYYVYSFGRTH